MLVHCVATRRAPSFSLALTMLGALVPALALAAPTTRVVPTAYPTIQAAIDAAAPGDRVVVLPGTYAEQLSIGGAITLQGSGENATIIRAPSTLLPNATGGTAIVDVHAAASVAISQLTVSGPGAGTCESGALNIGVLVRDDAHLDLRHATVAHIHDTPLAPCFHSGNGIVVGTPFESTASATISHVEVFDYSEVGILVFNEGSKAEILDSVVTGAGVSTLLATSGIEFALGSIGTIARNVVRHNACGSPDLGCGLDYYNDYQLAGILAGGPGTVITQNVLYGNQVGIYAFGDAQLSHNTMTDNQHFGLQLDTGTFDVRHERISGGLGGIWIVAAFGDTTAILSKVRISDTSGDPIQVFEDNGFTATIVGP